VNNSAVCYNLHGFEKRAFAVLLLCSGGDAVTRSRDYWARQSRLAVATSKAVRSWQYRAMNLETVHRRIGDARFTYVSAGNTAWLVAAGYMQLCSSIKLNEHGMRPVRFLGACVWFRDVTSFSDASGMVCVRVKVVRAVSLKRQYKNRFLLERRPYQTHQKRTWCHEIRRMRSKNA